MKIICNVIIAIAFIFIWIWVFVGTNGFDLTSGTDKLCFGAISLIISTPCALVLLIRNNRD